MSSDAARAAACGAGCGATLGAACGATVYTNAPERRREAVFGDLCTLLRPHRPPARVPCRNSVHKWPRTAPRDRFRRSVYTIASPCVTRGRPRNPRVATVYTNAPERRRKTVFANLCTLLHPHRPLARVPRCDSVHKWLRTASKDRFRQSVYTIASPPGRPRNPRVATVYTNAPERLRRAVFGDLCTLLHPPASPRGARATPAPQQCTQMAQNGVERPFSAICVHYCVPLRHHRPPARASRRNSVHNHEAPNIPAPGRRTSPRSG